MTKKIISIEEHRIIASEFSIISNEILKLTVNISNGGGKTKTRKYVDKLDKARKTINEVRFELEKDMLNEHDEVKHLYTERTWHSPHLKD